MPEHGGQNVGHAIDDGTSDRVPLPTHSFDPSQGSHSACDLARLRRTLRFPIQQEEYLAVADYLPISRCRRPLPV
jgi:hypothetical protein